MTIKQCFKNEMMIKETDKDEEPFKRIQIKSRLISARPYPSINLQRNKRQTLTITQNSERETVTHPNSAT